MAELQQLNPDYAVDSFLQNFRKLKHLPFLTDEEAVMLYGPEVAAVLANLEQFNREFGFCAGCGYRCCLRVKCEFYDAAFSRCMVQSCRPAICRMHFCEKFTAEHSRVVNLLADIYLESMVAAADIDRPAANLFDCPSFGNLIPRLAERIQGVLSEVRQQKTAETDACTRIQDLIERAAARQEMG